MSQIDTTLKGFQNPTGHNNCFLNVGLQSLWHLTPFHLQFVAHSNHFHDPECCLFCSLKLIFDQYKYSDSSSLPPTVIRNDLSFLFSRDSKFQLGQLDDAAEALESLLGSLHELLTQRNPQSIKRTATETCEPPCLVHRVFGIDIVQQTCCSQCAATSEPFLSNALIDYIPVAALRSAIREASFSPRSSTFSDALRRARSWHDQRKCANDECGMQAPVLQYLITRPAVYSVGLVWESDETPLSEIMSTLDLIGLELDTRGLYHQSEGEHCIYKLKGMVSLNFVFTSAYEFDKASPSRGCWVGFDDVIVNEVGPHWSSVLSKCKRGRDQPALLFYEKVESSSSHSAYLSPRNGTSSGNGVPSSLSPGNGISNMNGNSSVPMIPPPKSASKSHANGIDHHSHTTSNGVTENGKPGSDIGRTALARNNSDLINFAATAPPISSQPQPPPTYQYQPTTQPSTFVPLYANYSKSYMPDQTSLTRPITDYSSTTRPNLTSDYSRATADTLSSRITTEYLSTRPTTDYSSRVTTDYSSTRPATDYTPTRQNYDYLSRPPTDYPTSPYDPPTRPTYTSPTRTSSEDLSFGHRFANKISQKVHSHSSHPKPSPTSTTTTDAYAPGNYSSMTSLAPSSRTPTVHSLNYSTANSNPNPLYHRSPGTAGTTPTYTTGLNSTASTLRNRPDPFSSLLSSTMPSSTTPTTRGISPAHQRPTDPSQYISSITLSPAHQRPTETSPTRRPSPASQRPETSSYSPYTTPTSSSSTTAQPYTSPTRGVSPGQQRPDMYSSASSRGLSGSRSSAYPPPALNTIPAPTTRGVSPQRSTFDSSIPPYASRVATIAPPPSSSKAAMRSTAPARYTSDTSSSYYSNGMRNPSPARQSQTSSTISTTPPSTSSSATTAALMAKLARNASPTRTQPPYEPTSLYSRMDKSSTAAQLTRDNLDRGMEYSMQHLHLSDQKVKPIPVSAPPPRYTSPKRSYPASSYSASTSSARDSVPKLAPPPGSPSSFLYKSNAASAKKSVHFQAE